jgi:hypothetical protein
MRLRSQGLIASASRLRYAGRHKAVDSKATHPLVSEALCGPSCPLPLPLLADSEGRAADALSTLLSDMA